MSSFVESRKNQRFIKRMRFALTGVGHGLHTERSLRTQAIALATALVALAILRPAPVWWALVILAGCAVLAAELFNSALERLTDHLHPELHREIRIVKDLAAGGVLITSVGALGVAGALLVDLVHRL